MGGSAFKDHDTPRLIAEQYARIRSEAQSKLETLFKGIASPPTDPGKTTHGDIDFIVHTPSTENYQGAVADALGAVGAIPGRPTTNYLVPFDGAFAQIDVHNIAEEYWRMQTFLHSYSRLGHILSKMLLRFGLYLDYKGLFTSKPTPSKPAFLITSDLDDLLDILHLDADALREGFATREAMWAWLEGGSVTGISLTQGWRGSSLVHIKESDALMWEWKTRRESDELAELDQQAIVGAVLEQRGLRESFLRWERKVEQDAEAAARQKARSDAIKVEIARRLALDPAKGKAKGAAAKAIRVQVESEFPDLP